MARFQFRLRTIKSQVRAFFIVNIIIVIFIYVYNNRYYSQTEVKTRILEVSKENEDFLLNLGYLSKSIVVGQEKELKPLLETEISKYETNLKSLAQGGEALVGNSQEKVLIQAVDGRGEDELLDLQRSWAQLSQQLQLILSKPLLIDSSYINIGVQRESPNPNILANVNQDTINIIQDNLDRTYDDSVSQQLNPLVLDSLAIIQTPRPEITANIDTSKQDFTTALEVVRVDDITNPEVEQAFFAAQTYLDDVSSKNQQLSKVLQSTMNQSQNFIRLFLPISALVNIIVIIFGFFWVGTYLVNPLKKISATARGVASGDIDTKVDYISKDEIGEVSDSLNLIVSSFKQYTDFAENIGKGNFESNFDVKSEKDTLGYTLLSMRDSLKNVADEDKKRNWANEGFALFSDILRSTEKDIEEFSYDIISNLVKYLDANQGGLFLLNNNNGTQVLEMQAAFAYNKRKYEEKRVNVGQGLLGQVVLEKDIIHLDKIPQGYMQITSGLGRSNPRSLLIAPLKVNEEIYGAIELASFHPFEQFEVDFIERLSENIASTISSVKINENTKLLLDETRQYAEQMQAQEEEMRQNMEELAATQEEMERNQFKLEEYKRNLEKEVDRRTQQLLEKEIALSDTLSQLRAIIDSAKSGIVALNRDYQIVASNNRSQEIIASLREIQLQEGDNWLVLFDDSEDILRSKKLWDRAFTGESFSIEQNYPDNEGKNRWFDISLNPIFNDSRLVIGATMFLRDITDRTLSRKKTELIAHILDNSVNEVYIFDAQNLKFTYVNERGRRNLGYKMEEFRLLSPYEVENTFDRESFIEQISPLVKGDSKNLMIETAFYRKDGSSYQVEMNIQYFRDQSEPQYAAIVQDITARKAHEIQIEEALNRFDLATKATNEGIWEMEVNPNDPLHPETRAWWSERFTELIGLSPEEFPPQLDSWITRLHPEDRPRVLDALKAHLMDRQAKVAFKEEYRLLTQDHQYQWFSAAGETLRDAKGAPLKFAGSIWNIHRNKQAEQELAKQTAIVTGILNASTNCIISTSTQGLILSSNPVVAQIFGYTESDLVGSPIQTLFKDTFEINLEEQLDKVTEWMALKKDSTVFPIEVSLAESHFLHNKIYVFILRDASIRKLKEQQLVKKQEQFRKLSEATSEGVMLLENGQVDHVNHKFCQISGFQAEELIGQSPSQRFTPATQETLNELLMQQESTQRQGELIHKTGKIIPIELSVRLIPGSGINTPAITIRETSFGQVDSKQSNHFLSIMDKLPYGVGYTDAMGTLQYINPAAIALLNYSHTDELLHKSISFIHPQDILDNYIREWLPQSMQEGQIEFDSVVINRDKQLIRVKQTLICELDEKGNLEWVSFMFKAPDHNHEDSLLA